ncbi:MAG: 5'-3' exonuclease H3TH domain-containing protein, partial [Candidatus Bipolaricaulota bacterium]
MVIVSSDKDLVQLVDDKIAIVRPSARQTKDVGEILDRKGAYTRFEVPPERIIDFLSLVGDTADNIPGIPSVGKKRASQLLGRFGSLDGIMEHLSEIKSARVRENLIQHADKALLARKLVTLKKDVEVGRIPEDCALQGINTDGLVQLLTELEFRSVVSELGINKRESTKQDEERKASYHTVLLRTELDRLVTKLAKQKMFSIDLETTSRDPMQAEIVGIAISPQPYEGYYVPVGHDYLGAPCQLTCSE